MVARFVSMARDLDMRAAGGTELRVLAGTCQCRNAAPDAATASGGGGDPAQKAVPPSSSSSSSSGSGGGAAAHAYNSRPACADHGQRGDGNIATRGPAIVTRYEGAGDHRRANADVQRMLGGLIRQLDARRPQVLVEAIVVEIGDDAAKRLDVRTLWRRISLCAATSYGNASPIS